MDEHPTLFDAGPLAALRTFTVLVVPPCKWMNSNDRHSHWSQRSGPTKEWREETAKATRDSAVPAMERATVTAVVRRADRRTDTDAQNRYPTIKAAIDGVVDAGVLPDDKDGCLLALTIRPGPPVAKVDFPRGVLELIITEEALVPRIRSLKPGFFRSRSLAKCDPLARLTFAGMWTEADDHGRGVADARLIKGAIWALDDHITHLHVSAHIDMLAATEHIILYRVGDETYFQVLNWEPHQSAAFRRGGPQYPAVSAGQRIDSLDAPLCMQESASRTQGGAGEGRREKGEGNREEGSAPQAEREAALELPPPLKPKRAPEPGSDEDPDFVAFWKAYPLKKSKEGARAKWRAALKKTDAATLIAAAERYAAERSGADPKYTAHPTTWLNQGRWADEPDTPSNVVAIRDRQPSAQQDMFARAYERAAAREAEQA